MLYGELRRAKLDDGQEADGFLFKTSNGNAAILRLPSSLEMISRINSQRTIKTNLGRRNAMTETVPNTKNDLSMFAAIRVAGDDFDEFQARRAITQLTDVEVYDCQREGDRYKVTLKTKFGTHEHIVKIPSDKDLYFYRRGVIAAIELPHNREELRYHAEAGVELYDKCADSSTGYVDGVEVPAHHKFAVAGELSQACTFDDDFDPNS